MKIYKLKALCIAILGVSTKANDLAGVIRMKMRRVRNDRDQPIWGMSVAIAPIEQSEFHVMAFSLDHSNNVDETLDRCLKSSSLYEPERRDDETDLLNFDMHGVACWKISSAFKTQLFEKNKLMDNEEEEKWSILDSDEFLRLGIKGVYIIEQTTSERGNVMSFRLFNADESKYVSESDLVFDNFEYSGTLYPNQKVEIRFGDGMIQLPEDMYAVFLRNLEESGYKISEDHRYESLYGKVSLVLSLTDKLLIP
ncbi:unnamed protein product [Albugo candida]|uniref:Uncharacterized protein n=1 Tax=Albugo candida TaxID=65357 RepID=A0A024FUK9_9STRA|nr:unnamed protein product [Albugo candida]|eukprot:CCI10339.1 unnamed protein product [Albugo candida]